MDRDQDNQTESDGKPDMKDAHLAGAAFRTTSAHPTQGESVVVGGINWTDEVYQFTRNPGKYVVFNHKEFRMAGKPLAERHGTEQDVAAIQRTFHNLGYTGQVHQDLDADDIEDELKALFKSDFNDYGALFVFILTHGSVGGTLYARDGEYKFDTLVDYLVNEAMHTTLVGKPKIFIIQACRGEEVDKGVKVSTGPGGSELENYPKYLPIYSDLLMAYSSPPGFVSYRNTGHGSWFIQSLCQTLGQRSDRQDLESMLTVARRKVAYDKEIVGRRRKQIPIAVTTLTKTFYLTKNAFAYNQY